MITPTLHGRVSVEIRDAVAYVSMVRGEKHNALDWDMFCGLVAAAKSLRKNRDVRAVILSGDGPSFCSGLDVPSFAKTPGKGLRMFLKYGRKTNLAQRVAWCWRELPVPVIAVVHGRCYGGGMQIALACDFRFAKPDAEMSVMEVKWGLIPDMTGSVTLRELLPMDKAKELTMTGRTFNGAEAKQLNLITEMTSEPMAAAEKLAAQIKGRSPDAVAAGKALFQKTWTSSVWCAFAIETWLQWRMFFSRNQRIAMKAGMAKQPPKFGPRQYGG